MSWAILGEVPTLVVIGGGALCIGGVIVARSRGMANPFRRRVVPVEP